MKFPIQIIVEVKQDNMGNITARPKSDRYAKAFGKAVDANGGCFDLCAFFQEGMSACEFIENVPKRYRRDLERGFSVCFKADPWEVGHWYGYDAHTVVCG